MKVIYCYSTLLGYEMLMNLSREKCEIAGTYTETIGVYPKYDLGISFLYTHKIPAKEVAAKPWINFHPGPLPEMRGRNLAYHAIMNEQPEFGATLHYMASEYDTGDIIECRRFPILESHNAGDLVDIAHQTLAELFTEYVPRLLNGEVIPRTPQGTGKYYKKYAIDEPIVMTAGQKKLIRALTVADRYYASTIIGGRRYRFVPEGDE